MRQCIQAVQTVDRVPEVHQIARGLPFARVPVSFVVALTAIVVFLLPASAESLQYDRDSILSGEWWRILTGHFCHWNLEHLFWDVATFLVLGAYCEARDRWQFTSVVLLASGLISASIWLAMPDLETYRGLSGLDSALFAVVCVDVLIDQRGPNGRIWLIVSGGMLVGLIGKTLFELMSGATLFVDSARAGFQPVPLAHIAGAMTGIAIPLFRWRWLGRRT